MGKYTLILVALGGAIGSCLRYIVGKWFDSQPWGESFPFGTLFINVSGSFILGVAAVLLLDRLSPRYQEWYLLIGTGLCGGYTTFSTFELETFRLVRDGSWWYALINLLGSPLAGFLGILLAIILVNIIFPKL